MLTTCITDSPTSAQERIRPKIGLTLGGGGAKGLAHIGLLKAIDSAGLNIDYITGTSMGAVVGSLYAAGYSADSILQVARSIDWGVVLSNRPQLSTVLLPEKENYSQFAIELPIAHGKVALKRGILESNELWLKLAELLYPYYQNTNFNSFKRSFNCIATDLITGEMVVLKQGDIVKAVRASMAIPSVFTPVEYDGRILVDGGIVRNFPVSNVKEMGASLVIGSNVSAGFYDEKSLASPVEVMSQVIFFRESSDFDQQKKQADILVDYPLSGYSTASFSSAEQIIQLGLKKGEELYPMIKRLKDSLDTIYGPQNPPKDIRRADSILISQYEVKGLDSALIPLFFRLMNFSTGRFYKQSKLNSALRFAYGSRNFRKITYSLVALEDQTAKIIFNIERYPENLAHFGFSYNTTSGLGLKIGFARRLPRIPFSTVSLAASIGESPALEASYLQYFGKRKKMFFQAKLNMQDLDIYTYNSDFKMSGLYNQTSFIGGAEFQHLSKREFALGLGTRFEKLIYNQKILSDIQANGNTRYLNSYFTIRQNTLNHSNYPNRGRRLSFQAGLIYQQTPFIRINDGTNVIATEDSTFFRFDPFQQIRFSLEQYFPINRNAFLVEVQSGANFNAKHLLINDFLVGGLNNIIRNQVTFAGLPEASIFTGSVVSFQVGYQHAIGNSLFVKAKGNSVLYDFISSNLRLRESSFGTGCTLTAGYKSFLGPVEVSLMYSDINKKITPYFNIGFPLIRQ